MSLSRREKLAAFTRGYMYPFVSKYKLLIVRDTCIRLHVSWCKTVNAALDTNNPLYNKVPAFLKIYINNV